MRLPLLAALLLALMATAGFDVARAAPPITPPQAADDAEPTDDAAPVEDGSDATDDVTDDATTAAPAKPPMATAPVAVPPAVRNPTVAAPPGAPRPGMPSAPVAKAPPGGGPVMPPLPSAGMGAGRVTPPPGLVGPAARAPQRSPAQAGGPGAVAPSGGEDASPLAPRPAGFDGAPAAPRTAQAPAEPGGEEARPGLPALSALTKTRDRPLFVPGRRGPQPPPVMAIAPPAELPEEPVEAPPQLTLVLRGVVSGPGVSLAILHDPTTDKTTQMAMGEERDGWRLDDMDRISATFRRGEEETVLTLKAPGMTGAGAAATPVANLHKPFRHPQAIAPPVRPQVQPPTQPPQRIRPPMRKTMPRQPGNRGQPGRNRRPPFIQ